MYTEYTLYIYRQKKDTHRASRNPYHKKNLADPCQERKD